MKKRSISKKNLKLDALAWKASCAGQSYGVFIASLTEEERKQIYYEYEQLMEKRRREEEERMQRFRESQLAAKAIRKANCSRKHPWCFY